MLIARTTVAQPEEAGRIATDAVDPNLTVCVPIDGPRVSQYHWHGREEPTEAFRLQFRCLPGQLAQLMKPIHGVPRC